MSSERSSKRSCRATWNRPCGRNSPPPSAPRHAATTAALARLLARAKSSEEPKGKARARASTRPSTTRRRAKRTPSRGAERPPLPSAWRKPTPQVDALGPRAHRSVHAAPTCSTERHPGVRVLALRPPPRRRPSTRRSPSVPTLILSGAEDLRTPTANAREVAALIPGSKLLVVPDAGHSVLGSDPSTCSRDALHALFGAGMLTRLCRTRPRRPPSAPPRCRPRAWQTWRRRSANRGRPGSTLARCCSRLGDFDRQLALRALAQIGERVDRLERKRRRPALRLGGIRGGTLDVARATPTCPGDRLGEITAEKVNCTWARRPRVERCVPTSDRAAPSSSLAGRLEGHEVHVAARVGAAARARRSRISARPRRCARSPRRIAVRVAAARCARCSTSWRSPPDVLAQSGQLLSPITARATRDGDRPARDSAANVLSNVETDTDRRADHDADRRRIRRARAAPRRRARASSPAPMSHRALLRDLAVPLDRNGVSRHHRAERRAQAGRATPSPERRRRAGRRPRPGGAAARANIAPRRSARRSARATCVVFDQRGTGQLGPAELPALRKLAARRLAPICRRARRTVRAPDRPGARRLHDRANRSKTSRRSAQAAGYEKLVLYGTSYGTKVALEYAERYPQHVEALVLDSVVPANGPEPFAIPTFQAIAAGPRRTLRRTAPAPASPPTRSRDLARLTAQLRRHALSGSVYDGAGPPPPVALDERRPARHARGRRL